MIYLFHDQAGDPTVTLEGDSFKHMIKARRHQEGELIRLRHKDVNAFYHYRITSVGKKEANLALELTEEITLQHKKILHLGWCHIDPKSIEKVLPSLCEIGVTAISLIYSKRSQHHFKVDEKRLERIILNAMQQSGRIDMMHITYQIDLEDFIAHHPQALVLDFCDTALGNHETFETVILGPEGGFSNEEKTLLKDLLTRKFDTPMVLRSETAALAIASKLLL